MTGVKCKKLPEEENMEEMEKLKVLLPHWIEHNRGHAQECSKWSVVARKAGHEMVAAHIEAAISALNEASELLDKALMAAGGNMAEHGSHHHHHH